MTFQVELTPIAEFQIEQAYQWYRDRNPEFADGLRPTGGHRWFRSVMNRISTLHYVRHSAQAPLTEEDLEDDRPLLYFWGRPIVSNRPSVIDGLQMGCDRPSVSLDCGLLRWGDHVFALERLGSETIGHENL
jgi:hypothetical protein